MSENDEADDDDDDEEVPPWAAPESWAFALRASRSSRLQLRRRSKELREALQHCHKPAHLWNVHRTVIDSPYELDDGPAIRIGSAMMMFGGRGLPEWKRALDRLAELEYDKGRRARLAERERMMFRQAFRSRRLPFGKPDEDEAET